MSNVRGPIFVMGFPRSGTTGLATGLSKLDGISHFSVEGHFIYLFSDAIRRITKNLLNPNCLVRDLKARKAFLNSIATGVDAAYRAVSNCDEFQWIDKTPDIHQVDAIPAIVEMFPSAWFFYIYRDPVSALRSNIATWPDKIIGQESDVIERWVRCQRKWRQHRMLISPEKRLEIYQLELRERPEVVVAALANRMSLSKEDVVVLRNFWVNNRQINRPTNGQRATDYDAVKVNPATEAMILERCREEMSFWKQLSPSSAPR